MKLLIDVQTVKNNHNGMRTTHPATPCIVSMPDTDPHNTILDRLRNPFKDKDPESLPSIGDLREAFESLFLRGQNLEQSIAIIANNAGPRLQDPITHTVHKFLTEPVVCAVSPCGLLLFEQHPDLVIPFRLMNDEQRNLTRTVQAHPYRDHAEIATLMGGGKLIVHFAKGVSIHVPHVDVLTAVCRAALKNTQYNPQQKLQAANIIVQRTAALTNVPNSVLADVNMALQETINQNAEKMSTDAKCSGVQCIMTHI